MCHYCSAILRLDATVSSGVCIMCEIPIIPPLLIRTTIISHTHTAPLFPLLHLSYHPALEPYSYPYTILEEYGIVSGGDHNIMAEIFARGPVSAYINAVRRGRHALLHCPAWWWHDTL